MSSFSERLKAFMELKGISSNELELATGMGKGTIQKALKKGVTIGLDKVEKIFRLYPDLNIQWLITGFGEMNKGKKPESASNTKGSKFGKLTIATTPEPEASNTDYNTLAKLLMGLLQKTDKIDQLERRYDHQIEVLLEADHDLHIENDELKKMVLQLRDELRQLSGGRSDEHLDELVRQHKKPSHRHQGK